MGIDPIAQKAQEENQIIKDLLRDLLDTIQTRPQTQISDWLRELEAKASNLCAHLQAYFQIEEDGGFMIPVLEKHPASAKTIEALKEEHARFINEMNALIQSIQGTSSIQKSDVDTVCASFKSLIASLHQHERNENALIQTVFSDDIGTND
ncbi:MAG: hemerythrin domain-containing protein [bacterium]